MSFFTWFDVLVALAIMVLMGLSAWLGYWLANRRRIRELEQIQSIAESSYVLWERLEADGSCPSGVGEDFALIAASCNDGITGAMFR